MLHFRYKLNIIAMVRLCQKFYENCQRNMKKINAVGATSERGREERTVRSDIEGKRKGRGRDL
jgi:hypothetical protein